MAYTRNPTWQDYPDESTPISAAKLEHIESGIQAAAATADSAVPSAGFAAAVGSQVEVATLNNAFGATAGVPIKPWVPTSTSGKQFWALGNFETNTAGFPGSQSASTSMTLTRVAGGSQRLRTLASVAGSDGANPAAGSTFRIEFDFDATTVLDGWWYLAITLRNTGDGIVGQQQNIVTNASPTPNLSGHFVHDFIVTDSTTHYVEIELKMENNVTSGAIAVSNVTLKATAGLTPEILFMGRASDGTDRVGIARPVRDVKAGRWYSAIELIGSTLTASNDYYDGLTGYDDIMPWTLGAWADPYWTKTYPFPGGGGGQGSNLIRGGVTASNIRQVNNDQIIVAKNGAGTFEYRGNVHGGETTRTGRAYKIDKGDGSWVDVTSKAGSIGLTPCRRVQWVWPSQIQSSDQPGAPFATVDHTFTFFPDGVTRCDRSTTFNRSTEINGYFEWMASYDTSIPRIGRLGRGLTVIDAADFFAKVSTPATPTAGTATTGGTLAAATYSYRVSALSTEGESVPSAAVTQATTGSTSTVTVTWTAVTNATGYRVYGRTAGVERLLATVSAATLSYVDTGSAVPAGKPQDISTARRIGVLGDDTQKSDSATWAVWYDPISGWAHGNMYDRESIASRSATTGGQVAIVGNSSIVKQYNTLMWGTGDSFTLASGTVWSATHWSFVYRPENPDRFHNEIAVRAASLAALKSVYPSA